MVLPGLGAPASGDTLEPWFAFRLFCFSALAGSLFGYDTGVVSGALVSVRAEFSLNQIATEWFVSATCLAAAFGSLLSIPLNDKLGRRPVIFLGALLSILGAQLLSLAGNYAMLVTGRVLKGLAIGLTSTTAPIYASELAPPATRGVVVTLNDFSIVGGQVLAGLVNVIFMNVGVEDGWRYAMGLATLPAVLLVCAMALLPESPRWLYLKNDKPASRASLLLRFGLSVDGVSPDGSKDRVAFAEAEFDRMCVSLDDEWRAAGQAAAADQYLAVEMRRGLVSLFTEPPLRCALLLGILLMGMNQLSGINTVMYYSASMFENSYGIETSVRLAAACNIAQLCGVLISLATIDRHGRRLTALRSAAMVLVSLIGLSLSYGVPALGGPTAVVIFVMLYLVSFGAGLSGVAWVVVSEIYPMRVRAIAVAIAVFVNWVFNFLVSQSFLTLAHAVGFVGTFGVYGCIAGIGGLLIYRYLPETNGARLEDIERLFHDPYPANVGQDETSKEASALLPS